MLLILDIQGFKAEDNDLVVKEVAVTAIEEDAQPSVFSFEPPYTFDVLSAKCKSMNNWLTYNFHGIPWEAGDIPYGEVKETLQSATAGSTTVFVKGLEKKQWVEKYLNNVDNIEDIHCPALKKLNHFAPCTYHTNCWSPKCAVSNVQALKSWYLKGLEHEAQDMDVVDTEFQPLTSSSRVGNFLN